MRRPSQLRRVAFPLLLGVVAGLVAGCGGSRGDGGPSRVEPAAEAATTGAASGRVIATLGDSIVAGSPLWDPDPDTRAGFRDVDERSQWQRTVDADGAELRNCGVWGERTDEIAARYAQCTDGAEAVVIQGGINDIVQGRSLDDAERDLACLAERARGDGLEIALVEVLPWNNGWPDAADEVRDMNARIHVLGKVGGVPVLRFFSVLEDPERDDRMPERLTSDGNHPNVAGYALLGEEAWEQPRLAKAAFARDC